MPHEDEYGHDLARRVGALQGIKKRREQGLNAALQIGGRATERLFQGQREREARRERGEEIERQEGREKQRNILEGIKEMRHAREAEEQRSQFETRQEGIERRFQEGQRATEERFQQGQRSILERFQKNKEEEETKKREKEGKEEVERVTKEAFGRREEFIKQIEEEEKRKADLGRKEVEFAGREVSRAGARYNEEQQRINEEQEARRQNALSLKAHEARVAEITSRKVRSQEQIEKSTEKFRNLKAKAKRESYQKALQFADPNKDPVKFQQEYEAQLKAYEPEIEAAISEGAPGIGGPGGEGARGGRGGPPDGPFPDVAITSPGGKVVERQGAEEAHAVQRETEDLKNEARQLGATLQISEEEVESFLASRNNDEIREWIAQGRETLKSGQSGLQVLSGLPVTRLGGPILGAIGREAGAQTATTIGAGIGGEIGGVPGALVGGAGGGILSQIKSSKGIREAAARKRVVEAEGKWPPSIPIDRDIAQYEAEGFAAGIGAKKPLLETAPISGLSKEAENIRRANIKHTPGSPTIEQLHPEDPLREAIKLEDEMNQLDKIMTLDSSAIDELRPIMQEKSRQLIALRNETIQRQGELGFPRDIETPELGKLKEAKGAKFSRYELGQTSIFNDVADKVIKGLDKILGENKLSFTEGMVDAAEKLSRNPNAKLPPTVKMIMGWEDSVDALPEINKITAPAVRKLEDAINNDITSIIATKQIKTGGEEDKLLAHFLRGEKVDISGSSPQTQKIFLNAKEKYDEVLLRGVRADLGPLEKQEPPLIFPEEDKLLGRYIELIDDDPKEAQNILRQVVDAKNRRGKLETVTFPKPKRTQQEMFPEEITELITESGKELLEKTITDRNKALYLTPVLKEAQEISKELSKTQQFYVNMYLNKLRGVPTKPEQWARGIAASLGLPENIATTIAYGLKAAYGAAALGLNTASGLFNALAGVSNVVGGPRVFESILAHAKSGGKLLTGETLDSLRLTDLRPPASLTKGITREIFDEVEHIIYSTQRVGTNYTSGVGYYQGVIDLDSELQRRVIKKLTEQNISYEKITPELVEKYLGISPRDRLKLLHEGGLRQARRVQNLGGVAEESPIFSDPFAGLILQFTRPMFKQFDLVIREMGINQAFKKHQFAPIVKYLTGVGAAIAIGKQFGVNLTERYFDFLYLSPGRIGEWPFIGMLSSTYNLIHSMVTGEDRTEAIIGTGSRVLPGGMQAGKIQRQYFPTEEQSKKEQALAAGTTRTPLDAAERARRAFLPGETEEQAIARQLREAVNPPKSVFGMIKRFSPLGKTDEEQAELRRTEIEEARGKLRDKGLLIGPRRRMRRLRMEE